MSQGLSKLKTKSLTPITHIKDFENVSSNASNTAAIATAATVAGMIVTIPEAEAIVKSIESFPVEEIGCTPFLRMYGYEVERLTLQAHACAQNCDGDEYVVDAILIMANYQLLSRHCLLSKLGGQWF